MCIPFLKDSVSFPFFFLLSISLKYLGTLKASILILGARGTRDLPRPGSELVPPALAGGFFTTEQPGKPLGDVS